MPPATSRLAIDLSGSLIRVLEGAMGQPMRCGTAAAPTGAIAGGKVVDPAVVGQTLKQLAARTEVSETRAFIAVGDAIATFRALQFPATATEKDIDAMVARELPLDPERITTRWVDVGSAGDERFTYAAAWDRGALKNATDAVRHAGFDPVVVELKSAALARTVPRASCVLLDLSSDPVEMVLIDRYLPQVWHSFQLPPSQNDDIAPSLATPLRSILRFYSRDQQGGIGPTSPVLISGDQAMTSHTLAHLAELINQPVQVLPPLPRVPLDVRHSIYLACLGLIMRRSA